MVYFNTSGLISFGRILFVTNYEVWSDKKKEYQFLTVFRPKQYTETNKLGVIAELEFKLKLYKVN